MRKLYRIEAGPEHEDQRLDQLIAQEVATLSRTEVRKLLDLGAVHVDHHRTRKAGKIVHAGQSIEVHIDGLGYQPYRIQPEHVLFQDPYIIVINKPARVETQPTPGRYKGTLYEALLQHLNRDTRFGRKAEIGMVQRLDRETSGTILFSIHPRAHRSISHQFSQRRVEKRYQALVEGHLEADSGEFCSMLAKVRRTNRVQSVERGGKEAITRYHVLQRFSTVTLVEIELLTGRSHQIRAHFSEAGHPLVGDGRYGAQLTFDPAAPARHLLHARSLSIEHPVEQTPMHFEAPLPQDFHAFLQTLKVQLSAPKDGRP